MALQDKQQAIYKLMPHRERGQELKAEAECLLKENRLPELTDFLEIHEQELPAGLTAALRKSLADRERRDPSVS
ncbi:MAG: hypothetical protein PHQ23_10100, partial [Candidatus Wallbacteria bacterium]|nr:hypothetical protein [Candidatus Wallbacteria bacterium]